MAKSNKVQGVRPSFFHRGHGGFGRSLGCDGGALRPCRGGAVGFAASIGPGIIALLRDYQAGRASSYDRSGGNADNLPEAKAGDVQRIMEVQGPGQITHIWLAVSTDDPLHLKRIVLRAYWDGESSPSVEAPIGDFFGLGWESFSLTSQP